MDLLHHASHRPWALPKRPWIMSQTRKNLLFTDALGTTTII
ncbi:hypothetical protein [Fictibacillus sp. NRS-1165]